MKPKGSGSRPDHFPGGSAPGPCGHTGCGCAAGGSCCLSCKLSRCIFDNDSRAASWTPERRVKQAQSMREMRQRQVAGRAG